MTDIDLSVADRRLLHAALRHISKCAEQSSCSHGTLNEKKDEICAACESIEWLLDHGYSYYFTDARGKFRRVTEIPPFNELGVSG